MLILSACSFTSEKDPITMKESRPKDMEPMNSTYYTELYRPQYHFSTPTDRLADPNGLIYYEGEYHLFHQKMGNWAHAVSKDLVHWEHLPVALEHNEYGQSLSGSVVVDKNDSSGFFNKKSGLVAIYTNTEGGEAQSLAYSKDKGRTWEVYDGNPVIPNPGIKDFRDPKVFWHEESKKWVMVVSTNQSVTFYNSDNLIDWEYLSQFGDDEGLHAAVWETPDLFKLPVDGDKDKEKWVLHISVGDNNETNGSTAQYFIGEFDGEKFINDNEAEHVNITDFGQDYYAAQSFANVRENFNRTIWLGWMANWRYPYESPTEPWKGSMSIPRELELKTTDKGEIKLYQKPIDELKHLRHEHIQVDPVNVEGEFELDNFKGANYEFELIVSWDEVEEFGIKMRKSDEEETVFGFNINDQELFLDRTENGLSNLLDRNGERFSFGNKYSAQHISNEKKLKIHGFVDESSVEIFVNDGEYVFTNLIYPEPTSNEFELYSRNGSIEIEELNIYPLYSIWRERPKDDEVERIMVSEEYIKMNLGETKEIKAILKPDWNTNQADIVWEIEDSNVINLKKDESDSVVIESVESGTSNIIVYDKASDVKKTIKVRVMSK